MGRKTSVLLIRERSTQTPIWFHYSQRLLRFIYLTLVCQETPFCLVFPLLISVGECGHLKLSSVNEAGAVMYSKSIWYRF